MIGIFKRIFTLLKVGYLDAVILNVLMPLKSYHQCRKIKFKFMAK